MGIPTWSGGFDKTELVSSSHGCSFSGTAARVRGARIESTEMPAIRPVMGSSAAAHGKYRAGRPPTDAGREIRLKSERFAPVHKARAIFRLMPRNCWLTTIGGSIATHGPDDGVHREAAARSGRAVFDLCQRQLPAADDSAADFGGAALEGCNEKSGFHPRRAVQAVNRQFLAAGCGVIETDTFGWAASSCWWRTAWRIGLCNQPRLRNWQGGWHSNSALAISPLCLGALDGPTTKLPPWGT